MRTKTLLLGAAAFAAATLSSQAQNVYSQNIVGYVQVVVPQAPAWVCIANPLDLDGVDNITNVMSGAVKGATFDLWTSGGFTLVVKKSAINGTWTANAATTFIPPGVGLMAQCSSGPYTNTFVGSVIPAPSGSNTLALAASTYQLVGSPYAVSGTLTNAADQGPGVLNLGSSLPKNSEIETWNSGFSLVAKKSAINGLWNGNPTFTVGQGFFIIPGSATNWQQIDTNP
jgi:hypothetical protein